MKKGFTLAEVLITLGIIGVIAAMTLPTLIQNYQKQVYANGAKKGLNTITNLMNKIQADEGVSDFTATTLFNDGVCYLSNDPNNWSTDNNCEELYGNPTTIERIIPKYIKTVKTCKNKECDIQYTISNFNNNKFTLFPDDKDFLHSIRYNWSTVIGFYSADGIIYYIYPSQAGLSFSYDINGGKGPNVDGRDLFTVSYCRNGKINYSNSTGVNNSCAGEYSPDNNYLYRLISNGWKMDY